jgi:hypothetical protein
VIVSVRERIFTLTPYRFATQLQSKSWNDSFLSLQLLMGWDNFQYNPMATIVWGVGTWKCPQLLGPSITRAIYIWRHIFDMDRWEVHSMCNNPFSTTNICGFYTNTFLYWTPIFKCCVGGYKSQYMHPKTHVLRKWSHLQTLLTTINLIVNTIKSIYVFIEGIDTHAHLITITN